MAASERDIQPLLFTANGKREAEYRSAIIKMLPDNHESDQGDRGSVKETIGVEKVRPLEKKDLMKILPWFDDPEASRHLEPLPKLPKDWNDVNEVMDAVLDLGKYYDNHSEPEKITPLVAVNEKDEPLGVATIRWRGDPWGTKGHKIASIERVVVNPRNRGKEIGRQLMEGALETVFKNDFPEVRVWVFVDDKAGEDKGGRNLHFFHNILGFDVLRGENYRWSDYAKKRRLGENVENREAFWLSLKNENWEVAKKNRKRSKETHQKTEEVPSPK